MTRYLILAAPELGPFEFASLAILTALSLGLDPAYELVSA